MPRAIIFHDLSVAPLTDLRPSFDIRIGALTTLDRLRLAMDLEIAALFVPPDLEPLTREIHTDAAVNSIPARTKSYEPVLVINGRCPLPLRAIDGLQLGHSLVEAATGHLVAARIPAAQAADLIAGRLAPPNPQTTDDHVLIARPWHFRAFRDTAIDADLEILTHDHEEPDEYPTSVTIVGEHPAAIDPTATVYPNVTLVCEEGPIFIGAGAVVRPGAIIAGPAAIGEHATILERALIKPHTAIGPYCKVSGEIGGTIFQGYANKAHDGHLGDSWIGEWVNLGAGTTNSNLLNTYAEVIARATPAGSWEKTGQQFLGAIIGDHVKTAICARIMTGAVMGTGAMWAASSPVSGCVAPFAWVTDEGTKAYRLAKFVEVARAMMGRRHVEPSGEYVNQLTRLHARAIQAPSPT
jgi:UDP-N-acetylglucosamine diphosphorylase / glucose-1-phosphate thymidylyltransferase / UDP-N-acetylgalactosamine diphosphorylase / glucosamine-1-phosphate N-acetyltransferase / galactosamine-1-phosphate N-acetyltransferase